MVVQPPLNPQRAHKLAIEVENRDRVIGLIPAGVWSSNAAQFDGFWSPVARCLFVVPVEAAP